ncbi:MAG: sporulation protein YtfJ [Firmicutes bacterium]|jgi:sporulation protein YtfJ|nr:sporulation protein YtfJ [Bacillota bacterium]
MADHPIEGLMKTAMESIKDMVDVNTILGDPVETPNGDVIIPVSRVSFGFAAGGSEFESMRRTGERRAGDGEAEKMPFGGGSGAGITVSPVAFLVVGKEQPRLLPVDGNVLADRIIDLAPQLLGKVQNLFGRNNKNQEETATPALSQPALT